MDYHCSEYFVYLPFFLHIDIRYAPVRSQLDMSAVPWTARPTHEFSLSYALRTTGAGMRRFASRRVGTGFAVERGHARNCKTRDGARYGEVRREPSRTQARRTKRETPVVRCVRRTAAGFAPRMEIRNTGVNNDSKRLSQEHGERQNNLFDEANPEYCDEHDERCTCSEAQWLAFFSTGVRISE